MTSEPRLERSSRDLASEILEERVSYLELLKSFHDEVLKIIRIYTSSEQFTSERCLQEIVTFIQRRFNLYVVNVLLVDEIARELVLCVVAGDEPLPAELRNFRMALTEGLCGHAARTGEQVVAQDVHADPRFLRGHLPQTQSELCIPIRIKNRVVGVLDLEDRNRGRFKKDFITLMEDLAVNIGFVLENNRLYDNLRQYTESLEKKVQEKISQLTVSEQRYRRIVENTPNIVISADSSGRILWANRSASVILGYSPQEFLGMNIAHIIRKGHMHRIYAALRAPSSAEAKSNQMEVLAKGDTLRVVEFSVVPVLEADQLTGFEVSMHDVTEKAKIDHLKKNYLATLEEEVIRRTAEIKETQQAAILAIATLAESIDDDTGGHIQRIRHYSRVLAEEMKKNPRDAEEVSDEYIDLIFDLSPLHDLGKVGIRDHILQKTDKLTNDEFETMKEHTEIGARALRMAGEMIHRDSIFTIGEMIAHFHHEKWDGSGYPAVSINGEFRPLRGEEIPLCARIVALADVYDALTSKRPYKMPFPHEHVKEMLLKQSGKHFDPLAVEAFLRREQDFVRIREQFPDTHVPDGQPFVLPSRDRVETPAPPPTPASPTGSVPA